MGFFKEQFQSVIEWNETRDDVIFYKWRNDEIKKNSRLIIRPGQDAIFMFNGKVEGVFTDEGNYEMESEIIPFLTTLKSFKFGFSTPLRAEVLFINTKEFVVKWGTKSPINIPAQGMPGGMPIRCFGTYTIKIDDYMTLIDKVAGIKSIFTVEDVKSRILPIIDGMIMRSIIKEGKDMFNLQANSFEIARGIQEDLDMELLKIGLSVTSLTIANFNYPENIQKMIEKNASFGMVGDVNRYQKISMIDSMADGNGGGMAGAGGQMAQASVGMAMGMEMAREMRESFRSDNNQGGSQQPIQQPVQQQQTNQGNSIPCGNCGSMVDRNSKFCSNCGNKVEVPQVKFCSECGAKLQPGMKFCSECGSKQ